MTLADFAHSVLMHPVRLRLVQRLALLGTATVQERAAAPPHIPRASLYRHLRTLTELGYLTVVEETRVRGTVERTYALTDNPADEKLGKPAQGPPTKEELRRMLPALLISLIGEVERYLAEDEADPARDGLGVSAATLFMNDAEWRAFGEKLSALVMEAAALPPGEGRRQRRLTTILTPADMRPGRREK